MNDVVVDTRGHSAQAGPTELLGGIPMVERALRFARASGFDRVYLVGDRAALQDAVDDCIAVEWVDEPPGGLPVIESHVLYRRGDTPEPVMTIETRDDLRRAERWLWQSCRKPIDGVISRHLNRYISLFISRRLAPTSVRPNHVSMVTFTLGVASGVVAGCGGFLAFAIAGILFQLTSVLDGVDGELARVRYDGSILGEWLDTVSDDTSDVAFYFGVGFGAWRSGFAVGPLGPEVWLWAGIIATIGKLASMMVYYRWLVKRGRGDLLVFQWSFDETPNASPLHRVLSVVRYATKNDFIAFSAMVLGLVGYLPWLIAAAAPGTWVVAIGALREGRSSANET